MAASPGVPAIGTKYGPCAEPCSHRDCMANRKTAESVCRICGQRIGYEHRYYDEGSAPDWTHVHALCLEEEAFDYAP